MSAAGVNFQVFFEESPDVLLVLLPDSPRFTAVAATKARLNSTHSTLEQTIGRGLFELVPDNPDDPAANSTANLRASLERVLATKAADTMAVQKYDIPLPDGGHEVKYWSLRNIPILSDSGEVTYILHRAVDVTNLELANRELDAFSYSVAHDLRGPLRTIDGFSQLMLEDSTQQLNDQGRRRLDIVRASAQRMSQSIDDLLHLAKVSRSEVRRIPFELSHLVHTVAGQLKGSERERQVTLKVEEGMKVHADPHLLQIVLENLLRNAWKFTAKRTDAVVEFGSETAGTETCYYIRDNGAGFNMDYASKLFGVFQRLHPESEFQGSGIGLATVKRVVGRHGGRVWAVGEVGRGATFYFTLSASDEARTGHLSAVS
jgi:signal transduction histidine kinase